ncbi:hypothetical protein DPMN_144461 [Dreissena polymorpha]|uniref:Uncharacterized protein n=1 Tax=Dreissena polymorpha TaxID=45954 RepID=A0A9D4GI84_DREPO|nr:hypothetical protein DPMN_144461 [Dreissena polymorpha]
MMSTSRLSVPTSRTCRSASPNARRTRANNRQRSLSTCSDPSSAGRQGCIKASVSRENSRDNLTTGKLTKQRRAPTLNKRPDSSCSSLKSSSSSDSTSDLQASKRSHSTNHKTKENIVKSFYSKNAPLSISFSITWRHTRHKR